MKNNCRNMSQNNETKNSPEDEDDIISKAIGQFGKWQLQLTFLLSLVNIPCTWHIFITTFVAAKNDNKIWCAIPEAFRSVRPEIWKNLTEPKGFCEVLDTRNATFDDVGNLINIGTNFVRCTQWEFGDEGSTLISEFDLLCEKKNLVNIAEMMFLGGVAIGGLVCGILSDKFGRKRMLMISIFIQAVLGTTVSFVPYFPLYCILKAFLGFISVSVVFSGFVLSIELVGGQWRTVAGISFLFPVSISYVTISGMAWLIRDWRQLQLAASLPGFIFLFFYWVIPESPRWLLAMGRTDQLMSILKSASITNKKELPSNIDKQLLLPDENQDSGSANVLDLFKTHQMRKKTFLLFIIWFSVYLVYYGLVLNLSNIGGNLYLNAIISGLVEIPSLAISIAFLLKGGRRWPLSLTMIFSGIACALIIPFQLKYDNLQWLITTLGMISKFSISSSNAIMPVFTAELYPTTIRNLGVGASNVSAGVALMIVPYLFEMDTISKGVPMAVLAACGILGGLCVLFLPETANAPLQDTLKEDAHTS